ncbi:SusD/RagB family nutrient-binding outer membrane lipoprotein [Pontibacter sp. JH31]|uniref:SusD/RagB family nutrient-binding outer membrane lipoprotein n=1 Tax=Pontibacter aquaedesilientis TaxID=2766980 RepID=A0ABR7XJK7_9BACT|nr:SusD/RagB family nutrient-binding outer membrane lipoprotein [Pontibacter aquaedesilientis]MBD1398454.1 SusD/RagB family nutrient-binding outer membrane lipoprotein [Pontibacter aquaedesilientis]
MKKHRYISFFLAVGLVVGGGSCSDDKLDEIDTNPNNPEEVSVNLLLPQVTVNIPTAVAGADLSWYSSVFVQHTAGVHAQLQEADRRSGLENNTLVNNMWNNIYAGVLPDLNLIIERGSAGGAEDGNLVHVGIAKVLKAYTMSIATDIWGRVPLSEAGQGVENRTPVYDTQQQIYTEIQSLLDEAIVDLASGAPTPAGQDLIYSGNTTNWTRAAYSLKARFHNRLSNIDPTGSAQAALAAAAQGFTSATQNFTFNKYSAAATGQHPWWQEANDRSHHAVSASFVQTLQGLNDPRLAAMVAPAPDPSTAAGNPVIVGAPNGTLINDQANRAFSDVKNPNNTSSGPYVLESTSTLPLMTYDELKFIEAEAHLRLGNTAQALIAYQEGIRAAMVRQINAPPAAIDAYIAANAATVSLESIIRQKWIAFFYFQSIEAYNDWRRTGFPAFISQHPISPPPLRFPYAQNELDTNESNVPDVRGSQIFSSGVWWDDGTED